MLEQFLSACRTPEGSPHLPWDLLIVDECHNLMPSPFGEDSELCRMLRLVAPQFEHRLFLSATPHNGHTRSFTGLLEMLDPVRFTRTNEMNAAMRGRVEDVVVRRLKREINARSLQAQSANGEHSKDRDTDPRFCTRHPPTALLLQPDPRETAVSTAFDAFRTAVRKLVSAGTGPRRRAGTFAVEILGKRLLSCPTAFAESWSRARQGFSDLDVEAAAETALAAAARAVRQETGDDREAEQRGATAATVVGAWLRNFVDDVGDEIYGIERALDTLGFALEGTSITEQTPVVDARFNALVALIERLLRAGNEFRDDERLIVFTEYKTTLDYLTRRLREALPRGASAHALRHRRTRGHGRDGPRERQGGIQRSGLAGARARRDGRRVRGSQPAPHGPLPAALRLPLEPLTVGAAQRPARPLRPGPRRDGAPLRQRCRSRFALSRSRDTQGGRDPRGPRLRQRSLRPCGAPPLDPGRGRGRRCGRSRPGDRRDPRKRGSRFRCGSGRRSRGGGARGGVARCNGHGD